ncbi:MAG: FG-GAP repeat protein [Myxococcota bacterium]
MIKHLFIAALLSLLACTSASSTGVRLAIGYDRELTGLEVTATVDLPGEAPQVRPSAFVNELLILLPDDWDGRSLRLQVSGLLDGERVAYGESIVLVQQGRETPAPVLLARLPCGDWCTPGSTRCGTGAGGEGVQVCEQRDADGCFEWSELAACGADAPFCSLGTCGTECVDECAAGEARCAGPGGVQQCGDFDGDSCLEWGEVVACADGGALADAVCGAGACRAQCVDECALGERACADGGTVECGDRNRDGCLEWSPVTPCAPLPSGEATSCEAGACVGVSACSDECAGNVCTPDGRLSECGNYDLDPCLEPSPGTSCVPEDPCMEGRCTLAGCEAVPVVCEDAPPPTCAGDRLIVSQAVGTCREGTCDYSPASTVCPFGCIDGACRGGCDGVVCDTPPAARCDGNDLITFNALGTCADGACGYGSSSTTCTHGCEADECLPPPALCGEDQRVQGGRCVPCPAGEVNGAGDDPTSADTTCVVSDACAVVLGVRCDDFEEAYVKASNPDSFDRFGFSVATDGTRMAVGAPDESSNAIGVGGDESDNESESRGAVYVFRRTGTRWMQEAYIKAFPSPLFEELGVGDPSFFDRFGTTVDVDGTTLAVGAPGHEDSRGAAYIYTFSGGAWRPQAYLEPPFTDDAAEEFGSTLDLDGNTLAVSSPNSLPADGGGIDYPGAVFIFRRAGNEWNVEASLSASDFDDEDDFGRSLALDGDTLAVGAPAEDSAARDVDGNGTNNSASNAGAVYVFTRSGTRWSESAYLKASNADAGDRFGSSVALDGDTLAVGASGEASDAVGVGGDAARNVADGAGAVYVFTRLDTRWVESAYLKASNTDAEDGFGAAVRVEGDTIVVGAPGEDGPARGVEGDSVSDAAVDSGAVYIFVRSGGSWSERAYVKASNTNAGDEFGGALALSGGRLVIGAVGEQGAEAGVGGDETINGTVLAGATYVRVLGP